MLNNKEAIISQIRNIFSNATDLWCVLNFIAISIFIDAFTFPFDNYNIINKKFTS